MAKYRRISDPVDAVQWFKPGDHPEVKTSTIGLDLPEGATVVVDGNEVGYLGGEMVKAGDWIVTGPGHSISSRIWADEQFRNAFEPVEG